MRRLIVVALLLAASGVAHSKKYHNLGVPPEAEERQFTIDNGRCKQVAVGAAPMPTVVHLNACPSSYSLGGTATSTDGTRTTFSGTASPTATGGFAGGFAQGMGNGMALGLALRQKREQKEIYAGCMATLGWEEGKRPEQVVPVSYTSVSAPSSAALSAPKGKDEQWLADVRAFLDTHPDVTVNKVRFDSFDNVLREVAGNVGYANLSNTQKLQMAYNMWSQAIGR